MNHLVRLMVTFGFPSGVESAVRTTNADVLRLLVETEQGVFVRTILPAQTLPDDLERGPAAEMATRSAAAVFGLPDFVFRPSLRSSGSKNRELGDAIVVVGDVAAVVEVKARSVSSGDDARERSWLDKTIQRGARQASGTIRAMKQAPMELVNERGRRLTLDGRYKTWVPVVLIEHAALPEGYQPPHALEGVPSVILRRDWEFLFEQLKSTDAVIRYLHRVNAMDAIPLGREPVRYYELAAADFAAEPTPLDPRLQRPGIRPASRPVLPQAPAGAEDRRHHVLLRSILEDVALSPRTEEIDEAHMLEVLAAVDTLAVSYRGELGRDLMSWLRQAADDPPDEVRWRFRHVQFPDRPYLLFAVASRWNEAVHNSFSMLVTLRHQQQVERLGEDTDLLTVGVLLTPRHDGRRPWDTTLAAIHGHHDLDEEHRAELEALWPVNPVHAADEEDR